MDESKRQKLREKILQQKKDSEQKDYAYGKEFARGMAEGDGLDWKDFQMAKNNDTSEEVSDCIREELNQYGGTISEERFIEGFIDGVNEIRQELKLPEGNNEE